MEPQLDLGLHLLLVRHLRVMDERAATRVRWLVARGGVLQTLNDRGLATAIVPDDDGDGVEELDDGYLFVVEGANAADGQLLEGRHDRRSQVSARLRWRSESN